MKLFKTSRKILISCLTLLCLIHPDVQSQTRDSKFIWQAHRFIGISAGPTRTTISNTGASVISEVETAGKNSYCLSLEAGYFFSRYFGLSTGVGLSPFLTQLSLDSYSNSYDTVDSEGEDYERRISGVDIEEKQKIYFLEVPVMLNFQCPFSQKFGFYIQGGISLAIPVGKTYESSGTFSYSGYYPAYDVLLEDIQYEGFKSNVNNDVEGKLKVKTINPGINASGGFYFCSQKNFQVSLGFCYKRVLSDISAYSPVESFQLSTREGQARSLMEPGEKSSAASMGVLISLRYYLQ